MICLEARLTRPVRTRPLGESKSQQSRGERVSSGEDEVGKRCAAVEGESYHVGEKAEKSEAESATNVGESRRAFLEHIS
jgi:hypothetical protein